MTIPNCRFGFRIVGGCFETRRLVDAAAALSAHAAADPLCEPDLECYLSAFWFDESFRQHREDNQGSTAGYSGPCWSPWVWWDLDSDELQYAHKDAGALAAFLVERYGIDPGELLVFFSGSKGFHIGLPTTLWSPAPSVGFNLTARRFAERLAELASVTIDAGVYDKVRAFRAPNSRHPKTGLHKRRLTYDELLGPLAAILELAKTPAPFDVPQVSRTSEAAADWQAAVALVASEGEAKAARHAEGNGSPTLNRSTVDFIRQGASTGDRHRLLFSAAANLAEFGCTPALAVALLEESALDSGLPPNDVRRQIECGLDAAGTALSVESTHHIASGTTETALDGSTVKEPSEAATGDSTAFQGQPCQQVTQATESPPPADLQSQLAKLWQSSPAPKTATADPGEAVLPLSPTIDAQGFDCATAKQTTPQQTTPLPPLPPALPPLPPRAVGSGKLDKPCRCGSTDYAELPISEGQTRRDCRKCGRFVSFGKWYEKGGAA